MSNHNRIYLSPPHMGTEEQAYIAEAFDTNWITTLGPNVQHFESELSAMVGSKGAVALSSGTAAIHLALQLLDVGPGDTVFCSSLTFVASANPIRYLGAEPVFIDSEPASWNMSYHALQRAFRDAFIQNKMPKAVVIVNLYGQSADLDPLCALCDLYGVPIVEDAAESLGATYRGKASGTIGRFGIFSFNGNKIITTSGGGMLVSDDTDALERARFLSAQAREPAIHYQHRETGYNYRLSNILAGVGRGQLKVLDERIRSKRAIFERYHAELSALPGFGFMPEAEYGRATRWLSVMTVDPAQAGTTADEIIQRLHENNIEARPVWKPLHLQPLFAGCAYYPHESESSLSERLFRQGVCLPSGSNLKEEEQRRVMDCILSCLRPVRMVSGGGGSY